MSQPRTKHTSWVGWVISAILIAGSISLWVHRQTVVDAIQYYQYTPTQTVKQLVQTAGLTDDARFTFYAVQPSIESSDTFNTHCQRSESDTPILGCYASNRIHIFDVTDPRLKGIKVVTAAHELLHAEYDRMPEAEKKHVQSLLVKEYKPGTNTKLDERMKYYEKTEPGQAMNELHSIIGTEFESVSPELEAHYAKYFNNRNTLVKLHQAVDGQFDALKSEADRLDAQLENLSNKINAESEQYNQEIAALNQSIATFNDNASDFTSQSQFQSARQELVVKSDNLAAFRQQIQASIAEYKTLLAKRVAISTEADSLNKSLDSSLSEAPSL